MVLMIIEHSSEFSLRRVNHLLRKGFKSSFSSGFEDTLKNLFRDSSLLPFSCCSEIKLSPFL
jgi:hypothetical protein